MEQVVVGGTRNLLAAEPRSGAGRGSSSCRARWPSTARSGRSSSTSPAPFTLTDRRLTYSRCKRAAEALSREASGRGLPVVIVNPAEVYGPNDTGLVSAGNLIDLAKSNPVLVCRGGTGVVHVEDVAEGVLRALKRGRPGERSS